MVAKRKTVGKYLQVTVTAVTQASARRKARQYLVKNGELGWKFVGSVPTYKNPDKNEYVWAVSYRKRVNL
jgi:hypothetical protein